jgi:hypothetical protein
MNFSEQIDCWNAVKSALFGVAVGDALGVPVEFCSREDLSKNPVTDMIGGEGTSHRQPAGTWSDDSSLTFCLAKALTYDYNIDRIALEMMKWITHKQWTARGEVFDIGNTTLRAFNNLANGCRSEKVGETNENSNGNGSLMRILPLLFYIAGKPIEERFEITRQVSSITHGHIRSVVACFYYLEFARYLLSGYLNRGNVQRKDSLFGCWKDDALFFTQKRVTPFLLKQGIPQEELDLFYIFKKINRLSVVLLEKWNIKSSGYVVERLKQQCGVCYAPIVMKNVCYWLSISVVTPTQLPLLQADLQRFAMAIQIFPNGGLRNLHGAKILKIWRNSLGQKYMNIKKMFKDK